MAESTFVDDDDVEDFKLTKKELAERFRVKTTKEDIDLAISGAIPERLSDRRAGRSPSMRPGVLLETSQRH